MKIKNRLNLVNFLVISVILAVAGFSFLAVNNLLKDSGNEYGKVFQDVKGSLYLIIVFSALIAAGGVIIFRLLVNRFFKGVEQLNVFTETMLKGRYKPGLDVEDSDELSRLSANLNDIAESYNEKVSVLENTAAKRQKAVRELAILNELMGFISSEYRFEVILKNFVERTKDLAKCDYCAAIIFEPESYRAKIFVTNEGVKDSAIVKLTPEGLFKNILKNQEPLRLPSQPGSMDGNIKITELHIEVKNMLVLPLTSSSKLSGLLVLADKTDGAFDQEDEDMLMNFTIQAFQYIAMHEEIANLAVTDGLTGLNNHRNFQEKLKEHAEMARRYGMALSLLIADVDNFKAFNDIYGHQTGDTVLKSISSIIKDHIRTTDFAARYGGEEFAVIMPETSYNGAKILADRLRKKIAGTPFILPDNDKALITVSIGFASIPENARDRAELMEMADKALYFAKQHGRNLSYGFNETNMHKELKESFEGGGAPEIENLASIIDARTPYTRGHSAEVARLATLLAVAIGLESSDVESIRIASILHDVGTIHIPERVLNKPGELTEEERRIIQAHPGLAEMILKKYPHIEQVLPTILYHHERFDGNGYPTGISGDSIPLHARILAIAEAFHAMISARPYKKKLTIEEAVEELQSKSGSQFDPQLVQSFIKILKTASFA
jgi:diguanylate cyclase (GGDEF)-like protein